MPQSTKNKSIYNFSAQYCLYLLLLISPLMSGSLLHWQQIAIEILALCILFFLFLEKGTTGRPKFAFTKMVRVTLAFLGLLVLSFTFSQSRIDSFESALLLASYFIIYYAVLHCFRTRQDIRILIYILCGIAFLLSAIGLLKLYGTTTHSNFLTSVYENHNHIAGYLEMILPLFISLFLIKTRRGITLYILSIGLGTCVIADILTLSRGGWISLVISLIFMGIMLMVYKRIRTKIMLAFMAVGLCFFILFINSKMSSFDRLLTVTNEQEVIGLNGRIVAWKGTLDLIKDYPILGSGPGTYSSIAPQYQHVFGGGNSRFYSAHNEYLHFIADFGVLIIPLFFWWFITLWRMARKKFKSTSRQTWGVTLGAMSGIVAMLVHSIIDFNLQIPANAIVFIVLTALITVDLQQRKSSRGRSQR